MYHKSDTHFYITKFIKFVETQFCLKVKVLRSDNRPEFTMNNFYLNKDIIHQTSYVSTRGETLSWLGRATARPSFLKKIL